MSSAWIYACTNYFGGCSEKMTRLTSVAAEKRGPFEKKAKRVVEVGCRCAVRTAAAAAVATRSAASCEVVVAPTGGGPTIREQQSLEDGQGVILHWQRREKIENGNKACEVENEEAFPLCASDTETLVIVFQVREFAGWTLPKKESATITHKRSIFPPTSPLQKLGN